MRLSIPVNVVSEPEGAAAVAVGRLPARRVGRGVLRAARETRAALPVVRWLFYAFVFSLPFETAKLGPVEPPMIFGGLLLASALLQPGLFLRWPPRAFWCFVVYAYLFVLMCVLEPARYREEATHHVLLLVQLTGLGWIAYCLMIEGRVAERALLALVAACAALALLQATGIAAHRVDVGGRVERVTALGFHPNNLARILIIGLLALVGLTYGRARALLRPAYLAWGLFALMGAALVQTGSRGALIALCAGLTAFVTRGGGALTKLRNALGVLLFVAFLVWVASQSEIMRARFERTLEEGDLARREQIYPSAWGMFRERPLAGWGPISSTYELGSRLGHPEEDSKNPHNLILYALVSTGLAGAVPLFAGLGLAALAAWRSRRGEQGVLPLALVVTVLAANMSGVWLFNKLHWLVMAYALASNHRLRKRYRER
jgi:O-antigen ligase